MSDISTTSWTEVDASNSQQPPEGWPAGMNANGVEPSARMNMGAVKRFWNRVNPTYLAALATTDSYTVTPTQAITGYGLFEIWDVRFPNSNTSTSPNILISSLPAQPIRKYSTSGTIVSLAVGDIQSKDHAVYWDGTEFILSNPVVQANNPGTVTSVAANSDTTQGLLVGASPIISAGTLSLGLAPSRLVTKASPTSSDSVLLMDAAATNGPATATVAHLQSLAGWSPFSKSFASTLQTITAAGSLTLAHGLGAQPLLCTVELVCQTAEAGYSQNDVLLYSYGTNDSANSRGIVIVPDGTNLNVRFGSSGGGVISTLIKNTGVGVALTDGNWKVRFRAFA